MENASQALIMAGGILIAIIIISMGVYLFSQAAAIPKTYNDSLEQQRIEAFNGKFEQYISPEKKERISGQDIVTVINMATENNREFTEDDVYYIKVLLNGTLINNYTEDQKINLMRNTNDYRADGTVDFYSFECIKIEYNNINGKVNCIIFEKK